MLQDIVRPVGPATDETVLSLALESRERPRGWTPEAVTADVPVQEVTLLAPLARPPSIRDFYAFEQHVASARRTRGLAMHPDWYELPVFYFTNPGAVLGDGGQVCAPPGSRELDFELEVAMVLGAGGRDLRPADVAQRVAGYLVMNDWSARDVQRREMALGLGPCKGKDFATSLGPWLVTPDEFAPDPGSPPPARMTAHVNGRLYSAASFDELWWSMAEMACYASESADLVPGDVLGSGTAGTGCILELAGVHGAEQFPFLTPGDTVELHVEGLGSLTNTVGHRSSPRWRPDPRRTRPERVATEE